MSAAVPDMQSPTQSHSVPPASDTAAPSNTGRSPILFVVIACAAAALGLGARAFLAPTHVAGDATPVLRADPEMPGVYFVRPDLQPVVGTFAVINGPDGVPCVPAAAVFDTPQGTRVLVRHSPATVEPRTVRLGARHDAEGMVDVADGLGAGDRVALPGNAISMP